MIRWWDDKAITKAIVELFNSWGRIMHSWLIDHIVEQTRIGYWHEIHTYCIEMHSAYIRVLCEMRVFLHIVNLRFALITFIFCIHCNNIL